MTTTLALLLSLAVVSPSAAAIQGEAETQSAQAIYAARCAMCHGTGGAGDGPIAANLTDKPSDWTAAGSELEGMEDQQIFDVIAGGGPAIGKSEAMPANPQLSESEVWNLVAYVRSLKTSDSPDSRDQDAAGSDVPTTPVDPLKWGSALDWAIAFTIGISVLTLALIVVSLIVYRGRQAEGNALWLHLLALGIFPLGILAVGNFSVLEEAKQVRFCGACHTVMQPYLDDMHDAESTSLAALHHQHRFVRETECYSCHANYGVHGTFKAKLTGLVDVYTYVTRTYEVPVEMRTPFDNVNCLKCHDEAKRFMEQEIHLDGGQVSNDLRTGKISCGLCHAPAHDLARPDRVMSRALDGP